MKRFVMGIVASVMTLPTFGAAAHAQIVVNPHRGFQAHYRMLLTNPANGDVTVGRWNLQQDYGDLGVYHGAWASKQCNDIELQGGGGVYNLTIDDCNNGAHCEAQMYDYGRSLVGTLYCATGNSWGLELQ